MIYIPQCYNSTPLHNFPEIIFVYSSNVCELDIGCLHVFPVCIHKQNEIGNSNKFVLLCLRKSSLSFNLCRFHIITSLKVMAIFAKVSDVPSAMIKSEEFPSITCSLGSSMPFNLLLYLWCKLCWNKQVRPTKKKVIWRDSNKMYNT